MTYLVDTDTIIDYLKGAPQAAEFRRLLATEDLSISMMTYGETYEGIYYGRDPQAAAQAFRQLLRTVSVLPLTRRVMQRFARLRGELRSQGQLIGDPDILIAATALQNDLTLVTRNRQHFERVAGLLLHRPS